jgi:DNA processing protein
MLGVGSPDRTPDRAPSGSPGADAAPNRPTADERDAWAILAGAIGLGPVGFGSLLRRYGSAVAILAEASTVGGFGRLADTPIERHSADGGHRTIGAEVAAAIDGAAGRAASTLGRIHALGLEVVTIEDPRYPARLGQIEMPPHLLYVLGDPLAMDGETTVAVVGTRRPTDGGRSVAARLSTNLVSVGATVVSGLAVGIDGAAHAAAVRAGGTTIAVIGAGHAQMGPRAHDRLAEAIIASGGAIVSELGPDIAPSRGTFPRRNRIISGLADATVVIEAPARSGALITASWALEQGRECFLVPGGIDAPASAGCLAFLREFPDRARIVAGIPQLIADLGLADRSTEPGVSTDVAATLTGVGDVAGRIGREIVVGRATVDEMVAATEWPVATVLAALTLLERRGLIVGIHGRFRAAGALATADPAQARQRPRVVA